jgi:hypothetical protein
VHRVVPAIALGSRPAEHSCRFSLCVSRSEKKTPTKGFTIIRGMSGELPDQINWGSEDALNLNSTESDSRSVLYNLLSQVLGIDYIFRTYRFLEILCFCLGSRLDFFYSLLRYRKLSRLASTWILESKIIQQCRSGPKLFDSCSMTLMVAYYTR